jgi:hypothetical protein
MLMFRYKVGDAQVESNVTVYSILRFHRYMHQFYRSLVLNLYIHASVVLDIDATKQLSLAVGVVGAISSRETCKGNIPL